MAMTSFRIKVKDPNWEDLNQGMGNRWKDGRTTVILTPDDSDGIRGQWDTERGSYISGSAGNPKWARYVWRPHAPDLLFLTDTGQTDLASSLMRFFGITNITNGVSGSGLCLFNKKQYDVLWEIAIDPDAQPAPDRDTDKIEDERLKQLAFNRIREAKARPDRAELVLAEARNNAKLIKHKGVKTEVMNAIEKCKKELDENKKK